jgi:hypothetical protein
MKLLHVHVMLLRIHFIHSQDSNAEVKAGNITRTRQIRDLIHHRYQRFHRRLHLRTN